MKMQRTWDKHTKKWSFKMPGGASSGCYLGVSKSHAGLVYNLYVQSHKNKKYLDQKAYDLKRVYGCSVLYGMCSTITVKKTIIFEGKEYYRHEIRLKPGSYAKLRLSLLRRSKE